MFTVGASGGTLIKGAHNKSIDKTVIWGYSIVTGMRCGQCSLIKWIYEG